MWWLQFRGKKHDWDWSQQEETNEVKPWVSCFLTRYQAIAIMVSFCEEDPRLPPPPNLYMSEILDEEGNASPQPWTPANAIPFVPSVRFEKASLPEKNPVPKRLPMSNSRMNS